MIGRDGHAATLVFHLKLLRAAPRCEGSSAKVRKEVMTTNGRYTTNGKHTAPTGRNVLGGPLATCSASPLTGFYRTGCCDTGPDDPGVHVAM